MYIMRAFAERCFRTDHNFAIDESFFFFFDCPFIPDLGLTCKSTDLSITLLNIQSLQKHAIDISGDVRFHTDILSFPYRNKSSLMKIFLHLMCNYLLKTNLSNLLYVSEEHFLLKKCIKNKCSRTNVQKKEAMNNKSREEHILLFHLKSTLTLFCFTRSLIL